MYERVGCIDSAECIALITGLRKNKILVCGQLVKTNSLRLRSFSRSLKCVSCDRIGTFFAVERHLGSNKVYHLNLYAIDGQGQEMLMTVDHIVAKSVGGTSTDANAQTMCRQCNAAKGASASGEWFSSIV